MDSGYQHHFYWVLLKMTPLSSSLVFSGSQDQIKKQLNMLKWGSDIDYAELSANITALWVEIYFTQSYKEGREGWDPLSLVKIWHISHQHKQQILLRLNLHNCRHPDIWILHSFNSEFSLYDSWLWSFKSIFSKVIAQLNVDISQ